MEMVQWDSWEEGPSNLKNNEEMQYSALMYKSLLIWKCFVNIDSKLYEATLDNANIYVCAHSQFTERQDETKRKETAVVVERFGIRRAEMLVWYLSVFQKLEFVCVSQKLVWK